MTNLLLMNVGGVPLKTVSQATTSANNPQLQFIENFPLHLGATGLSNNSFGTLSVHAVNIPLSISFNQVIAFASRTASHSNSIPRLLQFGLYSLNGGTLSLANSASQSVIQSTSGTAGQFFPKWISLATSATQNISPGAWYFAFNDISSGTNWGLTWVGNSSVNPANANPGGFLMGRMTVSTSAMPGSIATSELDITGSDATAQPYIIITA